ncbi:MAG TPA: MATE family efflux transporter, partial [Hanamia sp.]|nr:MATE family efflux transporter [Hanamia sp.]
MHLYQAKRTLKLAGPIILGEVSQMMLGIIDTAMVGAVSYKQLAAAALVMSVINIPFVFGIGITISVSQMVSMAHGRRDGKLVSHYLYNGFWLCAVSAVAISLGIELSSDILFHLDQDPKVAQLALPYLRIMGWSVIPMLLFLALKQFTDGLEHTKTAMNLSLAALPLNVFLNWLLIYGNWGMPRLELTGAGWATLITRILIFIFLGLIVLHHKTFRKYIAIRSKAWKL